MSDSVFGVEVNRHLFYEVIKWQQAKRRAGTASTQGRNEVAGGGPSLSPEGHRRHVRARLAPIMGWWYGPWSKAAKLCISDKTEGPQGCLRSALSLRASQAS